LGLPGAKNAVALCIETMKHLFMDITQVVFCGGEKEGNDFSGLFDHMKHRFIEFNKVTYWDFQKVD
jgi:hypothetical protein